MGEMPMPGGPAMSMAWMPLCGQTWTGAAGSFLGMWVAMTAAMMLPSFAPALWRYRRAVASMSAGRLAGLTVLVCVGYLCAWTALGMVAYPVGVAVTTAQMQLPARARAFPVAVGLAVLIAGAFQFTAWKSRHLACCREAPGDRRLPADAGTAWRHGLRLGLHCTSCCGNLMAIPLVVGVMDLRAMALVTAAITAERLAPAREGVARAIGAVVVASGLVLTARAVALG